MNIKQKRKRKKKESKKVIPKKRWSQSNDYEGNE